MRIFFWFYNKFYLMMLHIVQQQIQSHEMFYSKRKD